MQSDERATYGASGTMRHYRVHDQSLDSRAAAVSITQGGERRVYTRRLRTVHAALVLGLSGVLSVGPIGEFITSSHGRAVVLALAVVAAGFLLAAAILRRGIVVTRGQVAIRGLFTTRRFSASDVERFDLPVPYGKVFGRVALKVVLCDGRVRTSGVFTSTPVDAVGTVGRRECQELNRWLALQGGTSPELMGSLPTQLLDARLRKGVDVLVVLLAGAFALVCLMGVVLDPSFGMLSPP